MFLFTRNYQFIVNLFLFQVCHFNGIILVVFCSCTILEDLFILFTGNLQDVLLLLLFVFFAQRYMYGMLKYAHLQVPQKVFLVCIPSGLTCGNSRLALHFPLKILAVGISLPLEFPKSFFGSCFVVAVVCCFHQILFQVLIILTGNYNFFNLLAIALLIPILDDEHLATILPSRLGEETNFSIYYNVN